MKWFGLRNSPHWLSVKNSTYWIATAHLCISGVLCILLPSLDIIVHLLLVSVSMHEASALFIGVEAVVDLP